MEADILKAVIHTMNQIEVKGKGNLDKLLGSINALEQIALQMEKESMKEANDG